MHAIHRRLARARPWPEVALAAAAALIIAIGAFDSARTRAAWEKVQIEAALSALDAGTQALAADSTGGSASTRTSAALHIEHAGNADKTVPWGTEEASTRAAPAIAIEVLDAAGTATTANARARSAQGHAYARARSRAETAPARLYATGGRGTLGSWLDSAVLAIAWAFMAAVTSTIAAKWILNRIAHPLDHRREQEPL